MGLDAHPYTPFLPGKKTRTKTVETDIKFAMSRGVWERGTGAKEREVTYTIQI